MCRLYAFHATEPTKVECTLVHAQNALLAQSRSDRSGLSHANGWGLATFQDEQPHIERQSWAAYHEAHFTSAAARIHAATVLAHIRRATIGPPAMENTHPFADGQWVFMHNGTVPGFEQVKPRLLAMTSERHRAAIDGVTDSEHVFRYLLTQMTRHPGLTPFDALRATLLTIEQLCQEAAPDKQLGLNMILSNGRIIVGTRLGRTLFHLQRDGIRDCEICGFPHVHHDPAKRYRAVVVASEPITHERWQAFPERCVYEVNEDSSLRILPLR